MKETADKLFVSDKFRTDLAALVGYAFRSGSEKRKTAFIELPELIKELLVKHDLENHGLKPFENGHAKN